MRYFSGFGLQNEHELFNFWLDKSDFVVAGFSYGAIKALEYALNSKDRIDRLILLSPAYFNKKSKSFKKAQLLYFSKDKKTYIKNFLQNAAFGSKVDLSKYLKEPLKEELEELLYYTWSQDKIKKVLQKGIVIEVVLGEDDKIIDSKEALDFFSNLTTTYFIKRANHILKEVEK